MLKKLSFLTLVLLSLLFIFSCEQKIDIETEKEAIKKVIEDETKFFWDNNYEEYTKTWVHEPYALFTSAGNSFHFELFGWDSIGIDEKVHALCNSFLKKPRFHRSPLQLGCICGK